MANPTKNTTPNPSTVTKEERQSATDDASLPTSRPVNVGQTMGTSTGEDEFNVVGGGWEGTDDATSTAPSDLSHPPRPVVHHASNVTPEDLPAEPPLSESEEFEMGTD